MPTKKVLYEGKAKQLVKGPNKDMLIQIFKDDATAYNKKKHKIFESKGVLNNKISEHIMLLLASKKIPTHFVSENFKFKFLISGKFAFVTFFAFVKFFHNNSYIILFNFDILTLSQH